MTDKRQRSASRSSRTRGSLLCGSSDPHRFKLVHDFSRAMYQKTEETRIQLEETVKAIQTEEGKQGELSGHQECASTLPHLTYPERAVKRMRSYLRLRAEARDQLASSDEE